MYCSQEVMHKEVIILTALSLLGLVGMNVAHGETTETYQNDTLGFKFQYPSEWKESLFSDGKGVLFDFHSIAQSNPGTNKVMASVMNLPRGTTTFQYFKQYIQEQKGLDYSTLRINEIMLSSFPATNATWDIKEDNNQYKKALTAFTVAQDRLYQIYYETDSEIFDKYKHF
jgi:hypothetical protein